MFVLRIALVGKDIAIARQASEHPSLIRLHRHSMASDFLSRTRFLGCVGEPGVLR